MAGLQTQAMRLVRIPAWILPAAALVLAFVTSAASAVELRFEPVAPGVYAHIGDLGGRSAENEGLNANLGLVLTRDGAVLIDSGATHQSARDIHAAIQRITALPVKWVINTGGQDHRWLGNGYFKQAGAELIAHSNGLADLRARGAEQLAALQVLLGDKAGGTRPTLPERLLSGEHSRLDLGGVSFEFVHRQGAHTPGDTMVWLAQHKLLFTGDVVYVDRMLNVLPVSHTAHWLASFAALEALAPTTIVPGHGRVTDLATAGADTRDLLLALRTHMQQAVEQGIDPSAATRSFDARPWRHLLNAAELLPGSASRTYLEVERE